jgi:hypothetical protein
MCSSRAIPEGQLFPSAVRCISVRRPVLVGGVNDAEQAQPVHPAQLQLLQELQACVHKTLQPCHHESH